VQTFSPHDPVAGAGYEVSGPLATRQLGVSPDVDFSIWKILLAAAINPFSAFVITICNGLSIFLPLSQIIARFF
jgi:predicted transcriptional regulator